MRDAQLDPKLVRMPPLAHGEWLQSSRRLTREELYGRVALIDFWDYTCVNCIRTFPYLKAWYERYARYDFVIIGIHSPEFKFAKSRLHIEQALRQHHLNYPILLDNDYENWTQFANKAWPTKYLVDAGGYIRLKRQGEGHYQLLERAIQQLLRQAHPEAQFPDVLQPVRAEDAVGSVCFRPTPEVYAGYQGGGLFGGGLGNPEGYFPHNPMFYKRPEESPLREGQFVVEGPWRAWPEALAFAGQAAGHVALAYTAAQVNAVLAPSADEVELTLQLRPSAAPPLVEVKQDGRYLTSLVAGDDVQIGADGVSTVTVEQPRLYQLVRNPGFETHELELIFRATGQALFAFTFSGCVAAGPGRPEHPTFEVH